MWNKLLKNKLIVEQSTLEQTSVEQTTQQTLTKLYYRNKLLLKNYRKQGADTNKRTYCWQRKKNEKNQSFYVG